MTTDIKNLAAIVDELKRRVEHLETPRPKRESPTVTSAKQAVAVEGWISGYGFARLGIISLVTGVAFLVANSYEWLGAPLKILLGYIIAAGFVAAGRLLLRRPAALSQILVAGGLGVAYYTTYAMHFVPSAQIVSSLSVALLLLAAMVVAIVYIAHRMQSETVAGVALFLGLHTGMVSPIGTFTLISSVLLACGAAFFLAKNRWVYVPVSTLLAVYSTHILWVLGNPMIAESSSHDLGHLTISIAFAALYFATFTVALVLAAPGLRRAAVLLFALLNWASLTSILCFEFAAHQAPGLAMALLVLAGCMGSVSLLCARLRAGTAAIEAHLLVGVGTLSLAALVGTSSASHVVIAWCCTSLVSLALARRMAMPLVAIASSILLLLAYVAHVQAGLSLPLAALLSAATVVHHLLARQSKGKGHSSLMHACGLSWLVLASLGYAAETHLIVLFWIAGAVALFLLSLALAELSYRIAACAIFVVAFLRLFLIDMASMPASYRIVALLALGLVLLAISYISTKGARPPTRT